MIPLNFDNYANSNGVDAFAASKFILFDGPGSELFFQTQIQVLNQIRYWVIDLTMRIVVLLI